MPFAVRFYEWCNRKTAGGETAQLTLGELASGVKHRGDNTRQRGICHFSPVIGHLSLVIGWPGRHCLASSVIPVAWRTDQQPNNK